MSTYMSSAAIVYSFRLLLHNLIHTCIYIWHVAEQSGGGSPEIVLYLLNAW